MDRRPRLLVIGDAVAATGFARAIRGIFTPLVDRWDIHQLGVNHWGDPHDWPWPIYPAAFERYSLGVERVPELLERIEPALVFVLNDPAAIARYLPAVRPSRLPVVAYAAYNSPNADPDGLAALAGCARLVVFTEIARAAVERTRLQIPESLALPPAQALPLGVDTHAFHPLDPDRDRARRIARERLFSGHPEIRDAFVVLNANRNQPRKRIDVTLEGFARFAAQRSGVYLHLHMGTPDRGWDLQRLARRLGVADRLILTHAGAGLPDLADAELNEIYNAADVGLNTASSEGWGLVSFEQAAAGLPQVVPEHTAGTELWSGAAQLLPAALTLIEPVSGVEEHLIDPADVAAALARLYADPELRAALGAAALERARLPRFHLPDLAAAWDKLFREVLAAGRAA